MFLSENAIQTILESLDLRRKLGEILICSDDWIRRLANRNDRNGDLTKYKVIQKIVEETKMDVADILVDEKPVPQLSK
jgi:hypothetical protein